MIRGNGPKSSTVDLHYRLQQPGSPSPRDADGFLRRKRLVEITGTEVPFTSVADTLMLSCISVAKAMFNREPCAGYVCDIRASANRLDEADQQRVDLGQHQAATSASLACAPPMCCWAAPARFVGAGQADPVAHRQ